MRQKLIEELEAGYVHRLNFHAMSNKDLEFIGHLELRRGLGSSLPAEVVERMYDREAARLLEIIENYLKNE